MATQRYMFGSGRMLIIPAGSNPTPQELGVLSDVQVSVEIETKDLMGSDMFAIDTIQVGGKVTGSAKYAEVGPGLEAAILGVTPVVGSRIGIIREAGTLNALAYTVANVTGFADEGVEATDGTRCTRVASAPATVYEYTVTSGGLYTFGTGATGIYRFSYSYTSNSLGTTMTFANRAQGSGSNVMIRLWNKSKSGNKGWEFGNAAVGGCSWSMKNGDYVSHDFKFSAAQDAAGNVFKRYND